MAQMAEQRAIERRNRMLNYEWYWRHARSMLQIPRLTDYSPDIGYFTYPMYAQIDFQELTELSESNAYPPRNNDVEDDYINGNVRIVLWRVVEQLIAHNIFVHLHLATPFHVGYELHEDELVVLRILKWPPITENTFHDQDLH